MKEREITVSQKIKKISKRLFFQISKHLFYVQKNL